MLLVSSYFGKLEEESKELEKLVILVFLGWEASLKDQGEDAQRTRTSC